jgi:hypothetical protein
VRGRMSFSIFAVSSRMLPFKASMVWGIFVYTICSGSPKERNREKSGNPGGHMLFPYQGGVNKCHSAPSFEASESYSCTVPAQMLNVAEERLSCFRSFAQILQEKRRHGRCITLH